MCLAAVEMVQVDGAALTAVTGAGDRGTLASSGDHSRHITELQLTTGRGPCFDAYTGHHMVSAEDLSSRGSQERWPGFAAAALEAGVWAVFAFPLLVGPHCCGTLLLYRTRLGRLSAQQVRDGQAVANAGLWALLNTRAGIPPDEALPPLGAGQDEVLQACGMVSVQLGVGVDEALVRLRAHAWAHDHPLSEVAMSVLNRRLRLDPDVG